MNRVVYLSLTVLLLSVITFNGYAHEGEKDEKPRKVTSETITGDHSGNGSRSEKVSGYGEQAGSSVQSSMEKDFQTIHQEVANSTAFIIIKALALAVAITGIALAYRRQREGYVE